MKPELIQRMFKVDPNNVASGFTSTLWQFGYQVNEKWVADLANNMGRGIYETHNTGRGYNFGFLLGASMAFSRQKGVHVQVGKDKEQDGEAEPECTEACCI